MLSYQSGVMSVSTDLRSPNHSQTQVAFNLSHYFYCATCAAAVAIFSFREVCRGRETLEFSLSLAGASCATVTLCEECCLEGYG